MDVEVRMNLAGATGARRSVPAHLKGARVSEPRRPYPVQQALEIDAIEANGMSTYRIVLPYLPPSKNQFDGWPPAWRAGLKRRWEKAIKQRVDEMNVPHGCQRIGLAVQLVFPTRVARRDPQNYAQVVWNFVPDALVKAGIVVDDNEGRIQIPANWGVKMVIDDRAAPKKVRQRTVIALTVEHAKPRGGA